MEPQIKHLIKRLGSAIDASLSRSEEIAAVIAEIRSEGYDVLLVLEATIGFKKRESSNDGGEAPELSHKDLDENLTDEDQQFLKSLSIRLDGE